MLRSVVAAGAVALAMLPGLASASVVATVDAGFNPTLQNTYFTITNDTGSTETALTLTTSFAPPGGNGRTTIVLGDLAAGATEKFWFNEVDGGFQTGAGNNGLDDSTSYQLILTLGGQTLKSNNFSPLSNLTGTDVDFLGNQCFGYSDACPAGVSATGRVAAVSYLSSAVPEPSTWALMIIGFVGVSLRFSRSIRRFA